MKSCEEQNTENVDVKYHWVGRVVAKKVKSCEDKIQKVSYFKYHWVGRGSCQESEIL